MELKPCPFCGGRANPPEFYSESKTARFINCQACGANVYRAHPGDADAILIAAWNLRTITPARKEMEYLTPDEQAAKTASVLDWQRHLRDKALKSKMRAARCPSTHCERRQECASPHGCIVEGKS